MKLVILIVSVTFLAGCAVLEPVPISQDKEDWSEFCFEGLGDRVVELAGKNAMSCGVYGINDSLSNFHRGLQCARDANEAGIPFILGNVDHGYDSRYCKTIIKDSKGEIFELVFDFDVEGQYRVKNGVTAYWESSCEELQIGQKNFDGSECTPLNQTMKKDANKSGSF
jgi:hypothetical protein